MKESKKTSRAERLKAMGAKDPKKLSELFDGYVKAGMESCGLKEWAGAFKTMFPDEFDAPAQAPASTTRADALSAAAAPAFAAGTAKARPVHEALYERALSETLTGREPRRAQIAKLSPTGFSSLLVRAGLTPPSR